MKKFQVIGNPIEHSLSPEIHNYWIKNNNINATYEKQKVNEQDLKSLISQIKNKEIDEIKDFLIDCEKLFENTSLEIQKKWKDFLEILNKKNIARKECLLLPIRTVLKALDIR